MPRPEGELPKFAIGVQTGVDITPDGHMHTFQVVGTDEGTIQHVTDAVHASGGTTRESAMSRAVRTARTVHGMPGEKGWNASWQPRGPENPPHKPKQNPQGK